MARWVEPPMMRNRTKSKAVISPSVRRPEKRMMAQSTKKTTVALITLSMRPSRIDHHPEVCGFATVGRRGQMTYAVVARMRPDDDAGGVSWLAREGQVDSVHSGRAVGRLRLNARYFEVLLEGRIEVQAHVGPAVLGHVEAEFREPCRSLETLIRDGERACGR